METLNLKAQTREVTGRKVKYLRQEGLIPAIVYGKKFENIPLQIPARPLRKVLREAGSYKLISLDVEGRDPQLVMARDIQQDPIRQDYLHVDFYAVQMDTKVNAQVPIELVGIAPAIENHGGILTQGLDELDIECLPTELIDTITVDVTGLEEINDALFVYDLNIPDTITILSEEESMIAKIEPPRLVADLEEAEEGEIIPTSAEPEVLTARDEEDEEEY